MSLEEETYLDLVRVQRRGKKSAFKKKGVGVMAVDARSVFACSRTRISKGLTRLSHLMSIDSFCCPSFAPLSTVRNRPATYYRVS